jgi:hypothetical protein
LKHYQTFSGISLAVTTRAENSEAYEIGKQFKCCAADGELDLNATEMPSEKAISSGIWHGSLDNR